MRLKFSEKSITLETQESEIHRLKALLVDRLQPEEIYLFGSAARRQMKEGSDIDLCLIFETTDDLRVARKNIKPLLPLSAFATDILFFDKHSFDHRSKVGGVCMIIAEDGELLYEGSKNDETTSF